LHGLLNRLEARAERQRSVTAKPSLNFADVEEKRRLEDGLRAAADCGAVVLIPERGAPHLIGLVRLADAGRLYRHLDRTPRAFLRDKGRLALAELVVQTREAEVLREWILSRWQQDQRAASLAVGDAPAASALLRAADAAFSDLASPLRARSARQLGDSKTLERLLPRILQVAREAGLIAPELNDEEARLALGLERVPPVVLVAGPLEVGEQSLGTWTLAGLAPEQIDEVSFAGPVRNVLTIENLESFQRHVREVRRRDEVVIYCGGYPSRSVIALLVRLRTLGLNRLYHWGDIDPAGLQIADRLATLSGLTLSLHLMTPELASEHGRPIAPVSGLERDCSRPTARLANYLMSANAHLLEQEALDPSPL
jgi:hypothetical protein